MSGEKESGSESFAEIITDGALVRLVSVIDISNMSVLELLEVGFSRQQVNKGLSKGIIAYVARVAHAEAPTSDNYFFRLLNEKVRLTELGLHILDWIKSGEQHPPKEFGEFFASFEFHPPEGPTL